jgi:hypothetical protein
MYLSAWANVLQQSFANLTVGLVAFIPNLIVAIVVFIIGWILGVVIGRLVAQVVDAIRVDQALRSAGVDRIVERSGFRLNAGAFLGALVKWFIIIGFLIASLDVLNLTVVSLFLSTVVLGYLPNVIAAVLILLVATVVADVAQKVVSGSARAANLASANFLGAVTRWAIWIFAVLAALAQLQVAAVFVQTLFTGVVVALALALGLSFGLGGQAAAARYVEHVREQIKD